MPTKQLEGKIRAGHVLMAEEVNRTGITRSPGSQIGLSGDAFSVTQSSVLSPRHSPTPVGYCIGHDQYFKRDDVGIIYQMNVAPGQSAKLGRGDAAEGDVRATRVWVQAVLLLVCAGYRGESVLGVDGICAAGVSSGECEEGSRAYLLAEDGFARVMRRRRIGFRRRRTSGSIREDRLVLPIPPGTHWRDAKPIVLPRGRVASCQ